MENNLYTFIRLCIGCRIFSVTKSVCSELLQLNSWVKEELISILEAGLDHVLRDVRTLLLHSGCTVGFCGPVSKQLMHCGQQQEQCVTTTLISDD